MASIEGTMKPLRTSQHYGTDGFKGVPQLGPNYADRREFLGKHLQSAPRLYMQLHLWISRGRIFRRGTLRREKKC